VNAIKTRDPTMPRCLALALPTPNRKVGILSDHVFGPLSSVTLVVFTTGTGIEPATS